ncbi:hypothetical protein EJB05_18790, partial [Eragrostis curvula]
MTKTWDVSAKVLCKGKINANNGQNYIRFILMDEEGSKMEAVAFGKACFTTNQGISEGEDFRTIYSEIDNEHNVSHVNAC